MSLAMIQVGHSTFVQIALNLMINLDQVVAIELIGSKVRFTLSSGTAHEVFFSSDAEAKAEYDAIYNDRYESIARVDTS